MNRNLLDTLNDISTSLAVLAQQIGSESQAGLGSRNKVAEHVLLPVLRRLYDAPGLVNTNTLAANYPGVDLFDLSTGLGVQVTSESTSTKIAETIDTLVAGTLPVRHLVIALATGATPNYRPETRDKWRTTAQGHFEFDPDADVFAFDRLLGRIQLLAPSDMRVLSAELQALVQGTHAIHLVPHLRQQVKAQLAEEQRIARYIPDVFVETQNTKYHARCFAHPALFAHRIADWFNRQPFAEMDRLAEKGGVPPVRTPSADALARVTTPEEAAAAAETLLNDLDLLKPTLSAYSEIGREGGAAVPHDAARAYVFDEVKYLIEMTTYGMQRRLGKRRTELLCITDRIFLLTGPAGQGKTSFLCDFAERFLLRYGIPCAYTTARQLSRIPHPDLTEAVRRTVFPPAVATLDEGLTNLASACTEMRQPFLLLIDGLNEHPDVRGFAGQLEHLLETLMRYPHVRVLMTCRSEFLEQRFGALLSGPIAPTLHVSSAHGQRLEDEQHSELVERYFQFFKVRRNLVASSVLEFLRRDVLLLRFFCEAYGARGRDATYEQPFVSGIYRDEIFRRYVEEKLGRAHKAVMNDQAAPRPLASQPAIRRVLSLVATHMLETGQLADVPRNVVPTSMDAELTALLDEELVLRHDLAPAPSLLAEPSELLNFTFDEMRDYFLAQHLLGVHAQDPNEFDRLLAIQQPTIAQSVEGVQRFLFYAARAPDNHAFLESYRGHPWYAAAYDTEVFAVPPTYLDAEDKRIIEEALAAGGERAQHLAEELVRCWEPAVFPTLNLEVLLAAARRAGPAFFTNVIAPAFGRNSYQDSLCEAVCDFVHRHVLASFDPDQAHRYDSLLRLLLLLLPVDATTTGDSPAAAVLRELAATDPGYALHLLQEALREDRPLHRQYLWSLLSGVVRAIEDPDPLAAEARADLADESSPPALRQEAEWFLSRLSANSEAS